MGDIRSKNNSKKMRSRVEIAEFLLAGDSRAAAVAADISAAGSWHEVLVLAEGWKVMPQLSARVRKLELKLTTEDIWTLRREFLMAHGNSALRATKAIAAIRALEQAGIPVAAFKGVAAMAVLYDGPKHRTIGDGDLLILRKDLGKALACLEGIGLARKGAETLDQYLKFVENAPRFAGNQAIALYGDDGSEIDLHWQLAGSGLHVEELLERSVKGDLMGSVIPVVDAKDGFVLTVHHAIREDLGIESMCRDLLDTRLWCECMESAGELEEGMKRAGRSGSRVAALAVTGLLRGYDDTTAAARAAEVLSASASGAERRSAARLMELFHYQVGNGRLERDVLYLVHWRPWRQIVVGLGMDWSGYRRSMEAMEKQLGEHQALYKRVALLARSIPGLRGLRLARALALAKYKGN